MTMPLPPEEEPTAVVSAPQRTASQLGLQVRHAAPAMPGVAGPEIQQASRIAGVSPLSDPWNAQAGATPGARLMNADLLRNRQGPSPMVGGEPPAESPVDGSIEGELGKTLGDDPFGEGAEARRQAQSAQAEARYGVGSRPAPVNDADHPLSRGGIFSDGQNMHHVKPAPMAGPSSGGSTGLFSSQVGAPGDGAV
jgi:hypothetical protein